MAREFPRVDFDTSADGFKALMNMLENLKNDRYPLWIAEWAHEHATEAIQDDERTIMRHEHFGRTELAEKARQQLAWHRDCLQIIDVLSGYLRACSAESFARDMRGYFKPQGKPDIPTTGRETKGIGKKS